MVNRAKMKKYIAVIAAVGTLGLCGSSYGMATEQIEQNPPFAPAGAIELVTLPRRDHVQLTIYNSTFGTSISDSEGYEGYEGAGVAMLIQESIEPESWFDLSDKGEGKIQVHNNTKLVVRQRREVHQEIEKLLQAIKSFAPGVVKGQSSITIDQQIVDSSETLRFYTEEDEVGVLSDEKIDNLDVYLKAGIDKILSTIDTSRFSFDAFANEYSEGVSVLENEYKNKQITKTECYKKNIVLINDLRKKYNI